MPKVQALLFDCDGVLLHSEMPLRIKIHEWLEDSCDNYDLNPETLMTLLRGKNATQVVEVLQEKGYNVHSDFKHKIVRFVRSEYPRYTQKVENVEAMLQSLEKFPKAICSNGLAEVFSEAMKVKELDKYFVGYFGRDNTGFAKPDPGVYLAGGKALKIPMGNCLIVEDSPGSGLSAANASKAGVIVGFTGSGANAEELKKAGAHYIINDLNELGPLVEKLNQEQ
jgi:HAD superfamily hydrolase (TIGR01509 family)